jgi:quinol monooxygenase YgiN
MPKPGKRSAKRLVIRFVTAKLKAATHRLRNRIRRMGASSIARIEMTVVVIGMTPASKSDEYLNLMRTVAIPDYRSTPGNKGAYALRRMEGDTAHFLMVTFWESEEAIHAFAGDDITVAKYDDFDKDFLIELEPCSTHYEMYDK